MAQTPEATQFLRDTATKWMRQRDIFSNLAMGGTTVAQASMQAFADAMNELSRELTLELGITDHRTLEALGELFINCAHEAQKQETLTVVQAPKGLIRP